jgi:hypothetical protein
MMGGKTVIASVAGATTSNEGNTVTLSVGVLIYDSLCTRVRISTWPGPKDLGKPRGNGTTAWALEAVR